MFKIKSVLTFLVSLLSLLFLPSSVLYSFYYCSLYFEEGWKMQQQRGQLLAWLQGT